MAIFFFISVVIMTGGMLMAGVHPRNYDLSGFITYFLGIFIMINGLEMSRDLTATICAKLGK